MEYETPNIEHENAEILYAEAQEEDRDRLSVMDEKELAKEMGVDDGTVKQVRREVSDIKYAKWLATQERNQDYARDALLGII